MALINTTTTGVLGSTFFGDGAGSLTVQKDGVTQGIFGNQPAFSAYQNTQQTSIPQYSNTKITFDIEEFDTNNNFASSRFTPTVAGYYQISWAVQIGYSSSAYILANLFKNGGAYKSGGTVAASASTYPTSTQSVVVYLNGTTDYVEIYAWGSNGTSTFNAYNGIDRTYFNGILVKAA